MKWGLVPVWAKSSTPHPCPVNARAETIHEKNTFKRLVDSRRCVVLAEGYFEWKRSGTGQGPYFFTPRPKSSEKTSDDKDNVVIKSEFQVKAENGEVSSPAHESSQHTPFPTEHPMLRMAGLYDVWEDPQSREKLYSYTVLTVFASKFTETIHDRMPALLHSEEDVDLWLNPANSYSKVKHLLNPSEELQVWPVSFIVGNVRNDSPDCIKPVDDKKAEKKLITSFFKPAAKSTPSLSASSSNASSMSTDFNSTIPNSWPTDGLNDSFQEDAEMMDVEPQVTVKREE
jgi:putative SOS response-associated peptidase YedK